MIASAVASTSEPTSAAAGAALGAQIVAALGETPPDALVVFISPDYDYAAVLAALHAACHPRQLIGCSSAGEFTSDKQGVGMACALALVAPELRFATSIGHGLRANSAAAAEALVAGFTGLHDNDYVYRTALVFTDALAGHADHLVEHLTLLTAGMYQFAGGGAGDNAEFRQTHVFHGTEVASDAVVALEILSNKPIGIGVAHGWRPASEPMRVTDSEALCLLSINAIPAVEVFEEHADATAQRFDRADPLPFFLHNVIGIAGGDSYRLRVPLGIGADGAVPTAADVPVGANVRIMQASVASATAAAASATEAALRSLDGHRPHVALFFDCVATRLRTGRDFGLELQALQELVQPARYIGFNSYGQIARAEGQFSGFHNCTAVVVVLPE